MVPIDTEPQPIILAYIDLNLQVQELNHAPKGLVSSVMCKPFFLWLVEFLGHYFQTLAAARMLTPTGPVGQTHWGDSTANNPSSATHSADAQLKVILVKSMTLCMGSLFWPL